MKSTPLALILFLITGLLSCSATAEQVKSIQRNSENPRLLSGIELKNIDTNIRLQDDFYKYANGAWLKTTEIPMERSSWTSFDELNDLTLRQLHTLIEVNIQKNSNLEAKKIRDFYFSFMDEAGIEKRGLKPITAELVKIAELTEKKQIPELIAHFNQIGIDTPYHPVVIQDYRDSSKYIVALKQSGIGLPNRDYYLSDDSKLKNIRENYQDHVEKMLAMSGDLSATTNAKDIIALETALAKAQWSKTESRDPVKTYNLLNQEKLKALTPDYNWQNYFKAAGIDNKNAILVYQPSYIIGFSTLLQDTPLAVWQAYFRWSLLNSYAPYLPKNFTYQDFSFYQHVLRGAPQEKPRWKRAITLENEILGDIIGKYYVAEYFPTENKIRMKKLVDNILLAYGESIDSLDWISPATKRESKKKLAAITTKIGHPGKWKNYSDLKIKKNDLIGNIKLTNKFNYQNNINKLNKPIDRDEWEITPQTVDAYYKAELNEIVFPAALLQPPFFNAMADDAVNYGAIGMIISHEISHGFDDQGSKFDDAGNLRDWWEPQDYFKFQHKTAALLKQYGAYSPLPGYFIDGELTLGENIADNSGLAIAYKAYKLSLNDKTAPVIDGLSGEQRFFLGFSQMWRNKMREEEVMRRIKIDSHSPSQFRVIGALQNHPGFYSAFGIKEGDAMYLPPEQRITIW